MSPTLFISDLHLHESRPAINDFFSRFLHEQARHATALYILGDLFEYWVGDDQLDHDPLARRVADELRQVADAGIKIFFMHGNRDFLIGERFAAEAGLTILADPTLITVDGQRLLLLHGDTLCTDDVAYQQFRRQARDPQWQQAVLARPYPDRVQFAQSLRMRSDAEKSGKAEDIMDVSPATVEAVFREYGYPTMIHGHTHRPARHEHVVDGHQCIRWVLADWYKESSSLEIDQFGIKSSPSFDS
ncbi:MAG: UDP-2,3-diacylglucosamine diphosphatase [Betaproteobacteria bacterium]|nr:UDP-2,3-diacylglucosamine diphosphatase [Betaproteobacteria bacterium]